jgi:asparagine synthetase B (glutamine-hydrolysing)
MGKEALLKLNGMFAFALGTGAPSPAHPRSRRRKTAVLCENGGSFLFGSEVKALIASSLYQPRLDREGLIDISASRTFPIEPCLRIFWLLPPATILELAPMARHPR